MRTLNVEKSFQNDMEKHQKTEIVRKYISGGIIDRHGLYRFYPYMDIARAEF